MILSFSLSFFLTIFVDKGKKKFRILGCICRTIFTSFYLGFNKYITLFVKLFDDKLLYLNSVLKEEGTIMFRKMETFCCLK